MINDPFDYTGYGVFDGEPFIPSYNREERRKYKKIHKKSNWYCGNCKCNVETVSDDNCNICCTLCGKMIGFNITNKKEVIINE